MQKPFKFRFDYCKNSKRVSFNTTLDEDLVEQLKYIKKNTKIPISKLIEVSFQPYLQNQETFDNFLDMVKKY